MKKVLIAALDENGVIGNEGKLPWKISEDMKHFQELTMGYPIVMGRKTWDSLPCKLPGRQNVVITNNLTKNYPGALATTSLESALRLLEYNKNERIYIIGGGSIYEQALPIVDKMEITHVHGTHEGDTYFPEVNWEEWAKVNSDKWENFEFATYERRRQ